MLTTSFCSDVGCTFAWLMVAVSISYEHQAAEGNHASLLNVQLLKDAILPKNFIRTAQRSAR